LSKTIYIPEDKVYLIREYFRVGGEGNDYYFVFFSGTLYTFNNGEEDRNTLDSLISALDEADMNSTADELIANTENVLNCDYVAYFMSRIPRVIAGRVNEGHMSIFNNPYFNVLESPEYKKLLSIDNFRDVTYDTEAGAYPRYTKKDGNDVPHFDGLFHGTKLSSAMNIVKKGITPDETKSTFLQGNIKHPDTVFLSSEYSTACGYAARWAKRFDTELGDLPVVFEIDPERVDKNRIVIDYDIYNKFGNGVDDKYEKVITNTGRRGYISAIKTDKIVDTVKDNPVRYNRVGYRGVVKPSAIRKIHVFIDRSQAMAAKPEFTFTTTEEFLRSIPMIEQSIAGLDEDKKTLPPYEADEFEIGSEGGNNDYFHLKESYTPDLSEIGEVVYSWDFDEESYTEWLADAELEDSPESKMEYITDNVTFDLEYMDAETFHRCGYDSKSYDEIVDMFGEMKAKEMIEDCLNNGEGRFETAELYSDDVFDINNPDELNNAVMHQMPHGEYHKNARGFILTNGVMVYTEAEHNLITGINGITSKFQFIRLGNIRVLPNSVDLGKQPTDAQRSVLREIISSYQGEEFYLDIFSEAGEIGAKYNNADWRYIMGEIDRYYSEGIRPQGGGSMYESVDENMSTELDQSEVNLSSFKVNDTLAPKLWDGNKLNPRARLRLLDIADDFWESTDVNWVKPCGIKLTGSICNFNWSKFSDIDLHLVVDFSEVDERKDFVQEYFDGKKNAWNQDHKNLKIYGYPVELYVEDVDAKTESGGIYDLEQNKWVKAPNRDDIKSIGLNKYDIKAIVAKYATMIEDICREADETDDKHILDEIGKKAHKLLNKIKRMRKFGLERSGESDPFNIAYKCYRRMGYLDMLFDVKSKLYDKVKSITESIDKQVNFFELAKERFGVTNDIRECGYILPDGSMLDFSGKHTLDSKTDSSFLSGRRSVDHRDISDLGFERDGKTKTGNNIDMTQFIRMGAIRMHASRYGSIINLYMKPTDEQVAVLSRLFRYSNGCAVVEIGDGDESLSYAEYEDANPRRIINDIIRYFSEGISLIGNVTESTRKNKFILKEYFQNKTSDLYSYFKYWKGADDMDKVEDLYYHCPYAFREYFEDMQVDDIVDYNDEDQALGYIRDEDLAEHFLSRIGNYAEWADLPSWFYMELSENPVVKNEWLVHFSNASDVISTDGFAYGSEEIDRLGLTVYEDKYGPGYNFAFRPNNIPSSKFDKYGEDFVMFRASGVEVFHDGDMERQVIFDGDTAKDFVYIRLEDHEYVVKDQLTGRIIYHNENVYYAIDWVINNYLQYRKRILHGKNGINEEVVADGNSAHNVYKNRWIKERELLKKYILNYGILMTSRENGKTYKIIYDTELSNKIGVNYCLCLQYDQYTGQEGNSIYVRALDKFTQRMFKPQFDTRGFDNEVGGGDDVIYGE